MSQLFSNWGCIYAGVTLPIYCWSTSSVCRSGFNIQKAVCVDHQAAVWEQHFRIRSDGADICSDVHSTKKKGSRRSVRVISSPVDWANWDVKLFICSQLWLHLSAVHVCTNIFCIWTAVVSIHQNQTVELVESAETGSVWRCRKKRRDLKLQLKQPMKI